MIFDTHMHTEFSFDSNEKIERLLEASEKKNLGIITTEHKDLNYEEVGGFPIDFNVDEYFEAYEKHRSDRYLMGIEMGLDHRYTGELKKIADSYEFDMIIGSLHTMKGFNLSSRKYLRTVEECAFYKEYLLYAKDMIEENSFINSFAHFDYPTRYSPYKELKYEDYPEEFKALFQTMVQQDVTLEMNLKRPLTGDVLDSFRSVFKGYYDCGGRFVTLASDAHSAEDIGRNFEEAQQLVDDIGLKICYYKRRKRITD